MKADIQIPAIGFVSFVVIDKFGWYIGCAVVAGIWLLVTWVPK